jgi:carboxypeptidase PM20D1
VLPGVDSPAAMIGVSEKGYLTLRLTVQGVEGHASAPPASSAIGVLARAIQRLESNPLPARLDFISSSYKAVGAAASPWLQLVIANTWLFGGLLRRRLSASPQTNAAIRTTTAVTLIQGGIKDNILPPKAEAAVNFRLLPGDGIASMCDFVRRTIADERVNIAVPEGGAWEASPLADIGSEAFRSLSRAVRQVYPQAVAAPYLTIAATDGRHYTGLTGQVFRFTPFELDHKDLERFHGVNERISIQTLARMVQFYYLLLQDWAG